MCYDTPLSHSGKREEIKREGVHWPAAAGEGVKDIARAVQNASRQNPLYGLLIHNDGRWLTGGTLLPWMEEREGTKVGACGGVHAWLGTGTRMQ